MHVEPFKMPKAAPGLSTLVAEREPYPKYLDHTGIAHMLFEGEKHHYPDSLSDGASVQSESVDSNDSYWRDHEPIPRFATSIYPRPVVDHDSNTDTSASDHTPPMSPPPCDTPTSPIGSLDGLPDSDCSSDCEVSHTVNPDTGKVTIRYNNTSY